MSLSSLTSTRGLQPYPHAAASMVRVDSGVGDSFKGHPQPSTPIEQDSARPLRRNKTYSAPDSNMHTTHKDKGRDSIDGQRSKKSSGPRRESVGSSSNHSTSKTRKQGQGSRHSSRRTSATYVDPKRPARHYRLRSSQTVPTTNRDVDDVLALHFRSCSLFHDPSYSSSIHRPPLPDRGMSDTGILATGPSRFSGPTSNMAIALTMTPDTDLPKHSEDTIPPIETHNTIINWTSPSTRRREYEEIDRSNSGLRSLVRRMTPRCFSGPPPPKFYEKDASDAGSVRRYRIDLPDHDDEDVDEKSTKSLRQQKLDAGMKSSRRLNETTKRWGCF